MRRASDKEVLSALVVLWYTVYREIYVYPASYSVYEAFPHIETKRALEFIIVYSLIFYRGKW